MSIFKYLSNYPIQIVKPFRRRSAEIPLHVGVDFLQSDDFTRLLILNAAFRRGLPDKEMLQNGPGIGSFLWDVLVLNRSEDQWQSNSALEICDRTEWLQAELDTDGPQGTRYQDPKTVYVFASDLHRR